jgi:hypothetical protein
LNSKGLKLTVWAKLGIDKRLARIRDVFFISLSTTFPGQALIF